MASLPNAKTVTYEEWLRMPEVQDAIEEVVKGEIRIMPANKLNHALVTGALRDILHPQLDRKAHLIVTENFGLIVRTEPLTSRVPDLAVFERGTMVVKDGYVHSAPQLAVEVLSPGNTRREMEEKLGDYASIGVPEVWVISPEARTVEVLYLDDGYLRRSQILAEGLLQPKLFPHVQVDIAQIWPD